MSSNNPSLKILFLCTAHNSLSQRLALVLGEQGHYVTVELALSPQIMIEAATLASPDLVICPYLVKKVPAEVYEKYLTLVIHPGPPGDAGPSALDWALLGDDGSEPDAEKALEIISSNKYVQAGHGRSHWGVTVLQAIEEFDAGPVWAWDQFPISLDGSNAPTKASLYRGPVTQAATTACLKAIERILSVAASPSFPEIHPGLRISNSGWTTLSVTSQTAFQGGKTLTRPLLKPTQRAWPVTASAEVVSRRLRSSDSQPGVQSSIFFGKSLYLYGGIIEENPIPFNKSQPGSIVAQRDQAVLVSTADGKGVWVTHIRRLKPKNEKLLPAKLPAMLGLKSVAELKGRMDDIPFWRLEPRFVKTPGTFQEVYVEYESIGAGALGIAYVYSDLYNGAASTSQCKQLLAAITEAVSTPEKNISALVLMGGSYWNNGIHLGVCSTDLAAESWANINAINDCVKAILEARGIVSFAFIRGNAAAGGFALATCCDYVFCVDSAVINPHYRAVGLYGSEYHSLTWYARAGEENTREFMRGMLPMSADGAKKLGLVDRVIPSSTSDLISDAKSAIVFTLLSSTEALNQPAGAPWTRNPSSSATPINHRRLVDAVPLRKAIWFDALPQPLSCYRKQELDFMKLNFTDPRYQKCALGFAGKEAPQSTPFRFALHRRMPHWQKLVKDPEEDLNYFDYPEFNTTEVHQELKIPAIESIFLVPPPPLTWRPTDTSKQHIALPNTHLYSPEDMSRCVSETTTLLNSTSSASPSPPRDLPPPSNLANCDLVKSFEIPNTAANKRLSRVVHRLKSALTLQTEVADSLPRTTMPVCSSPVKGMKRPKSSTPVVKSLGRPHKSSLITSKHPTQHQMTCYYNAVETA